MDGWRAIPRDLPESHLLRWRSKEIGEEFGRALSLGKPGYGRARRKTVNEWVFVMGAAFGERTVG